MREAPRLRKLVAEGVVVVLSILVAFGLDAWWDGRVLRAELEEELVNVESELVQQRQQLALQIDLLNRIISASDEMVALFDAEAGARTIMVDDTLAAWVFTSPTLDPSLGAVEALIASGRLSAVEDPELRRSLAGLSRRFDDAIEDQLMARAWLDDAIRPEIASTTDFGSWTRAMQGWWSDPSPDRPMVSTTRVQVPATVALRNAIIWRRFLHWVAADQMADVDAEVARALELVGNEVR